MTIELQPDELVLLIQALQIYIGEKQKKTLENTPFEAQLLTRLVRLSNEQ